MRNMFRITVLAGLLMATAALAQQYTVTSIAITNSLAPAIATTQTAAQQTILGGTNSLTKWGDCALQFRGAADAADSSTITLLLVPSVDGVNFSSQGGDAVAWPITMNGTTTVTAVLNLTNWPACGYWKISYITNAHSSANVTNGTIKMAVKPRRSG